LFSKPEYVWMMYQCLVLSSVMAGVAVTRLPAGPRDRPIDHGGQSNIDQEQINPEQQRRENDDHGRRPHFAARRPRHPSELAAHVAEKAARAAEPVADLLRRL